MTSQSDHRGHCRRVAAVAHDIAQRLSLPQHEQQLVIDAALIHHHPVELLDVDTLGRLTKDTRRPVGPPAGRSGTAARLYLQELLDILLGFHSYSCRITDQRLFMRIDVVATSDLLMEAFESHACEHNTREQILKKLNWKVEQGLCRPVILKALSTLPQDPKQELLEVIRRLPVYPVIALRVLALSADEDVSFRQLESVVSCDQVLASRLVSVANSPLHSPRHTISTIRQAISYIGIDETRKVVTAAAFHPLFASANLRNLWKHSLEMARLCEELTSHVRRITQEEACLAGLVHDIGRLAIWRLSGDNVISYARLIEEGCEPVLAELYLFGFDHGEVGAEILRFWGFPEHLVEAVENHHQPQRSQSELSSLLHLAELRCAPGETAPCRQYPAYAIDQIGVPPDALEPAECELGMLREVVGAA